MVSGGQLVLEVMSGGGNQGLSSSKAGLPALAQALLKPAGSGQPQRTGVLQGVERSPVCVCVSKVSPAPAHACPLTLRLETVLVPPGAVLQVSDHGIHSSRSSHVPAPPVPILSSRCALIKGQPSPEASDAPGRDFRVLGLNIFSITLGPRTTLLHAVLVVPLSIHCSRHVPVPWGWRTEEEASPVAQGPRV